MSTELFQSRFLEDPALQLYTRLEGSSTDLSANARNGTDTAVTYSNANGHLGGMGAGMNGTTSGISFPSFNIATTLTACAWIKPTSNGQFNVIFAKWNDNAVSNRVWSLVCGGSSQLRMDTSTNGTFQAGNTVSTAGIIVNGVWQHVAIVTDGVHNIVYYNGANAGQVTATAGLFSVSQAIGLGSAQWNGGGQFFNGAMDDFAVFSRALSPQEIWEVYSAGPSVAAQVITLLDPVQAPTLQESLDLLLPAINPAPFPARSQTVGPTIISATAADTAGGTDNAVASASPAYAPTWIQPPDPPGRQSPAAILRNPLHQLTVGSKATSLTGSDTAGGTDAATQNVVLARTGSDTAGGTDVATRVVAFARTSSDTAGGTDAATRALALARTGADTAGGTDAATRLLVFARTSSDTAGGTDSATRVVAFTRTGSDTAGGTDAATRALILARTGSDTAGGTDQAVNKAAGTLFLFDGALTPPGRKSPASIPRISLAGQTRIVAASTGTDTAGGTDAATRALVLARYAVDQAHVDSTDLTDENGNILTDENGNPLTSGGTPNPIDVATRGVLSLHLTGADTAGGTDVAVKGSHFALTGADTAGATDVATRVLRITRIAGNDTAGGTDGSGHGNKTAGDTAGGTDAALVIRHRRFTPPVCTTEGPINPDTEINTHQYRLRGYYPPLPVCCNVWKLPDGTYTENQPYPLITPDDVRQGNVPINGIMTPTYVYVYYGAHSYDVSDAEAAALEAAGFVVSG